MQDTILPSKSDDEEPVPTNWRDTFSRIVDALKDGNFSLIGRISGVASLSESDAHSISRNIAAYGEALTSLPEEAWNTSICRWTGHHWDVLVDLFTEGEGRSDLVMFSRVLKDGDYYKFIVDSVHVP